MLLRELVTGRKANKLYSPWCQFNTRARVVTLFGHIISSTNIQEAGVSESTPCIAEETVGALMLLAQESSDPVKIAFNNVGGSIQAGFLIVETIEHLQAKGIEVIGLVKNESYSVASVILAACTKGKRFCTHRGIVHLHMPKVSVPFSREEDADKIRGHQQFLSEQFYRLLAERTNLAQFYLNRFRGSGSEVNQIREDAETQVGATKCIRELLKSEMYLSPREAVDAGIIDDVLGPGDGRLDEIFKLGAIP